MNALQQTAWMMGESFALGAFLYFLLRLRPRLGAAPLLIFVGTLQFVSVVLALGVYVEISPGFLVSPGSVVLFPATVLGALLVYIVDDGVGARRYIYSLLIANIALSVVTLSVSVHTEGAASRLFLEIPLELFLQNPRMMVLGTGVLFLDTVLIIVIYEALGQRLWFGLRLWVALAVVLAFDSLGFGVVAFFERDDFWTIVLSGMAGKMFFSIPLAASVVLGRAIFPLGDATHNSPRDVFQLLTFRQRYEEARVRERTDALTGLANRGAFDFELAAFFQSGAAVALVMVDIDHFKSVNDDLGHQAGDQALESVASLLSRGLRGDDRAYRYGGEEFALVLPGADAAGAEIVAERTRDAIESHFISHSLSDGRALTISLGLATTPNDGQHPGELIGAADRRLYAAKAAGRNRVRATDGEG